MGVLEMRCDMKKKQHVIEIIVYVLILLLLIFGVKNLRDEKAQTKDITIPAVETPAQADIDMERVQ